MLQTRVWRGISYSGSSSCERGEFREVFPIPQAVSKDAFGPNDG